jgi:uncharacterized glyoxalase superfamily protein PhnB
MATTESSPLPTGYRTVTPYFVCKDAARLIQFLKDAFDARERYCSVADGGRIQHAEYAIGDTIVMLGEGREPLAAMHAALYVVVDDCDASYQRALAAGATSKRPPMDQSFGARTAGVIDPAGNEWWLSEHEKK